MNTDVNVNQKSIYFDDNYIKIKTALNIAIENENIEIINKLLQHPDININLSSFSFEINGIYDYSESEKCPIHVAIEKSNMNIIKLLVSHPQININSKMFSFKGKYGNKDSVEKNALHMAIEKNNLDIIKFLITIPKLNVNSKATYGNEYIRCFTYYENHVDLKNLSENQIAFDPKETFCKKRLLTPLSIDFKIHFMIHMNHENSEIKQILSTRPDFDSNNKSDFYCGFYSFSYKDRLGVKYESYDYSENDNELQNCPIGYGFPLK